MSNTDQPKPEQGGFVMFGDIMTENGKTIRQNNMELQHNIPLGALVEVAESGIRMFVGIQGRDCDGEPLYWLQPDTEKLGETPTDFWEKLGLNRIGGYCEESLTVIRPPTRD